MSWSFENLQFVVFVSPGAPTDAYQLWLEIFQAPPDGYQRQTDPNAPMSTATGAYGGYSLQIQSQTGRIDLSLLGQQSESPFPVISAADAALPLLQGLAVKLAETRNCVRLALVSVLFENRKSLPEANKLFAALTNQGTIPAGASDLTFGLNIRKQYTNDGFVLNRLLRWTSLVKQIMQFQIGVGVQEPMPPIEQPAVVLNLDVNTAVRPAPFKSGTIKNVVSAIFAEHNQLKDEGYGALVR